MRILKRANACEWVTAGRETLRGPLSGAAAKRKLIPVNGSHRGRTLFISFGDFSLLALFRILLTLPIWWSKRPRWGRIPTCGGNWHFWPEVVILFSRHDSKKGSSLSSKLRSVGSRALWASAVQQRMLANSHMPGKTNYSQADTNLFINRTVEGGEAGAGIQCPSVAYRSSRVGGRVWIWTTAALFNTGCMWVCAACFRVFRMSCFSTAPVEFDWQFKNKQL